MYSRRSIVPGTLGEVALSISLKPPVDPLDQIARYGRLLQRVGSPKTSAYLARSYGVVSVPSRVSSA